MRKALLIVAMLLLATPVMAGVTITAVAESQTKVPDGNNVQTVRIDYSGNVDVRAFALDINTETGPTYENIRDFHRGESNTPARPGKGYGIFPSRFRDFIVVTSPNWVDTNYNPTAAWAEPESNGTGLGFHRMIVELGALYDGDANKPNQSGTLFRFDVKAWGSAGTFHVFPTVNTLRGGVVDSTGTSITPDALVSCSFAFSNGVPCPNIVGLTTGAADACIVGAGLVVKNKTGVYSLTVPANQVMTQDPLAGVQVPVPSDVNYVYSMGDIQPPLLFYPKYDPDSNIPVLWSSVALATSYELDKSVGGGAWANLYTGTLTTTKDSVPVGFYKYRIRAKSGAFTSTYNTGTYDCNAYLSKCYPADSNDANWKLAGRPDCWCKASTAQEPNGSGYQCDGDADGTTEVTGVNYRVYNKDLAMVTTNWKKKAADLTNDPNTVFAGKLKITGGCADFDHKPEVTGVNYRVYNKDLAVLTVNWKKKNSSTAAGTQYLPGNCPR